MKRSREPVYQARARVAKALAHPARLRMLDALEHGERCAGDLAVAAGIGGPSASAHLAFLLNAGLVVREKRGQHVFYRTACSCITSFFTCLDAVAAERRRAG